MQKFFQLAGILSLLVFSFLLFNTAFPKIFSLNIEGINNWAGGLGGLLFGILLFLVGSSKEASKGVGKSISDIGNGWFRVGDVIVNENPQKFSNRKK